MSAISFPDKYHIVWLDAHIGEPDFCLQLKRAFFTQVDPQSYQVVSPSDEDINHKIQFESEIPVTFDNFHFTLRAFVNEVACLKYIDRIQCDRIIFIASSTLGRSAVEQLLKNYSHSFTNTKTNQPYSSIYIFCADIDAACDWIRPYCEYVKVFDFETDLLARMTKDIGTEFLEHGQELLEACQAEAAIERFTWSRSLFIRHYILRLSCLSSGAQQSIASQKLQEVDKLLENAEKMIKQQQEMDTGDVSKFNI